MRFAFDRSPVQTILALVVVLCMATQFRLWGVSWDQFAGLHPDERHLLFLSQEMFSALADPANGGLGLTDWWFSPTSPLNPHLGERSYVYGEAPLLAGVLAGWWLGVTDWFDFMSIGRVMASLADTATVLAVFLGARLLARAGSALVAAILYAAMPTALQLANFHTVDVWLSTATTAAMVPLLALATGRMRPVGPVSLAMLAGGMIGLAMAAKLPGLILLGPAVLAIGLAAMRDRHFKRAALLLFWILFCAFLVFRLANPFAFDGSAFPALGLSPAWLDDLAGLAAVTSSPHFPPNWQWLAGYGVLRLMRDVALFGIGPVCAGLLGVLVLRHKGSWGPVIVPLSTFFLFFLLAMTSSVSALRYAAPGFAPLAIALAPLFDRIRWPSVLALICVALWWGAGAVRLHDGQHPRVAASHWLWTLPKGTTLTNETSWDESLPVIIALKAQEPRRWPSHDNWFVFQTLEITDADSPEKADRIAAQLARTDFLILSSDRHQAVMPRLPDRFPMTAAHYGALLSGNACFSPVLVINRGYPLPGLRLDDAWAQEPWRVYDHPIVRIFRREPCFDEAAYAALLKAALKAE